MSEKAKKPAAKTVAKKALTKTAAKKAVVKKASAVVSTTKVKAVKPLAKAAAALKNDFIAKQVPAAKATTKASSKVAKDVDAGSVTKKVTAKKVAVKKVAVKKVAAKSSVAKKAAAKSAARSGKKPSSSGLPARKESTTERLRNAVLKALDDMKAKDVVVIDVRPRTSITDDLVFASGTSTRPVKSIADEVVKAAKAINMPPIGVEGEREGEWVLVDLADVVVHVMLPATREFYGLERLWSSAAGTAGA